jgi:hypothetical protein
MNRSIIGGTVTPRQLVPRQHGINRSREKLFLAPLVYGVTR